MHVRDQFIVEQTKFQDIISLVENFIEVCLGTYPESPIRIRPNWPHGWQAKVVCADKVWTIECKDGELDLVQVGDYIGLTPNGAYVEGCQEKIEHWKQDWLNECWYEAGGMDGTEEPQPASCENLSEPGAIACKFCPTRKRRMRDDF